MKIFLILTASLFLNQIGAMASPDPKVVKCVMLKNLCYIRADFGLAKDLSVVIDTGSSLSVINQRLAYQLKKDPIATGVANGIGTGAGQTYSLFNDVDIKFENISLSSENIVSLPIDYIGEGIGYPSDGILGLNLFSQFVVDYHFKEGTVSLTEANEWATPSDREQLSITIEGGTPFLMAKIDLGQGKTIEGKFLVDTGQVGAALTVYEGFQRAHPELIRDLKLTPVQTTGVGGTIHLLRGKLPGFWLGTLFIDNPSVTLTVGTGGISSQSDIAGAIGADLLSNFDVAFDYKHGVLSITPNRIK